MQSKQSKAGNSNHEISSNSHNAESNTEEELISEIAERLGKEDDTAFDIGKLIDSLVQLKGGVKYGGNTIERISQHPKVQRSPKQLRRFWGYYLVYNRYGDAIRKIAPRLGQSYYYELARLLRLGESGNGSDKAGEELVGKQILKHVRGKASNPAMTVDEFREEISKDMAHYADDKTKDDECDESDEPTLKEKKPHPDKKRRTSKIADLLSYDDKGFELVSDWFTVFADPDHLKSSNVSSAKVCHQVNRVAESLAAMIEFLISKNEDGELNANIFKKISDLAGKVGDHGMGQGNSDNCQNSLNPPMKEVA